MVAVLAVSLLPKASPVSAAEPVEVVFSHTGAEQQFEVLEGVDEIHVKLVGGKGGNRDTFLGGLGGLVEGDLAVAPGMVLFVEVGGNGGSAGAASPGGGGFNGGASGGQGLSIAFPGEGPGGGGGGGASDIRTMSRSSAGSLDSRLMVAGGGGGGGAQGGGGGAGAAGGGPCAGMPGTSTGGGAGGSGGVAGASGAQGVGGIGGTESLAGGGGGGGLFGGGGGSAGTDGCGGGGGGGSSFTGDAANASLTTDTTGVPSITITYTQAPNSGVVDADVTVPTSAACIELSSTSITFGTQRFGGQDLPATPSITVTNCSGSDETLLARGTDATGGGATWNLVDEPGSCGAGTLATDAFHLKLQRADTGDVTQLAHDNKTVRNLAAGAEGTLDALIDMPCPGSSGAGQTMGMQIVFVVVEQ